jgi:predicted metal-dependent enzyme (double-stranded beta helix superfamily)
MVTEITDRNLETQTFRTDALEQLIAAVRRIVDAETNARRVARAVRDVLWPHLHVNGLLTQEQMEPDPLGYRQHILHVEADGSFSVAVLVWLPGQETPIHDHVSWCVVGVYKGTEYETRYELSGEGPEAHLVEKGRGVSEAGSVDALVPPGDIHRVANDGGGPAVSLHIYGADLRKLGCSIRRRYDLPVRS